MKKEKPILEIQPVYIEFHSDKINIYGGLNEIKDVSGSMKGKYYSPSFFNSWENCPAKTIMSILSPKEDFIAPLEIGSCVHTALESKYKNGEISPFLLDELKHNLQDDKKHISKMEEYLNAYEEIGEIFDKDTNHYTELEIIKEVSPLGIKLPKLKGFIDRLDISSDEINIVDYKTSSKELEDDKYLDQLTIYKWLVEEEYSSEVSNCYVCSLYPKNPRMIKQDITLCSQSRLIEKILRIDEENKESFKQACYEKRGGWQCRWCPFNWMCKNNRDFEIKHEVREIEEEN